MDPNWLVWTKFFAQLVPIIIAILEQIGQLPTTLEAKAAMLTQALTSVMNKAGVPVSIQPAVHELAQDLAGLHLQALAKAALLK